MRSYNSRVCGYPEAKPEGEPETRELCQAPNPRTRYSLSNLYHPGMRGFERVATRANKKCGLCPYLIRTFGPIGCIKSDVRWYKYIYMYGGTYVIIGERAKRARHYQGCTNSSWCGIYIYIYIYIYVWRYVCHISSACHAYVMWAELGHCHF